MCTDSRVQKIWTFQDFWLSYFIVFIRGIIWRFYFRHLNLQHNFSAICYTLCVLSFNSRSVLAVHIQMYVLQDWFLIFSFDSDILLGLMKRLVRMRSSNLKVLITSATLDGAKVSNFFSNCPVLTVPGKLFPVEVLYSRESPTSYLESSLKTALGTSRIFDLQLRLGGLLLLSSLTMARFS